MQLMERMNNSIPEEQIIRGDDDVYRWIYGFSLLKNPIILFVIWKVLVISFGAVWILVTLISMGDYNFWWDGFLNETKGFALLLVFMLALGLIAYLIYAAIMGGRYYVLFEMDEKGVKHIQLPGQFNKARSISELTVLLGLAVGNIGTVGSGMLAGSRQYISSEWVKVKSVAVYPRMNTVKVNGLFNKNQIYAPDESFEFVKRYIIERCNNARLRIYK